MNLHFWLAWQCILACIWHCWSTVDILEHTAEIHRNAQTQSLDFIDKIIHNSQSEAHLPKRVHCFSCPRSSSSAQHTVIEGQTHHGLLVAAVLPLDLPRLHAPQAGQVVRGG